MTKKEEILNNILDWSLCSDGSFRKEEEIKLDENDTKEIRKAIINKVKENPNEWEILEFKDYFMNRLVNNASKSSYQQDAFTPEEWKEIKNIPKLKIEIIGTPSQQIPAKLLFFADVDWRFISWAVGIITIGIIALMFLYNWIKSSLSTNY